METEAMNSLNLQRITHHSFLDCSVIIHGIPSFDLTTAPRKQSAILEQAKCKNTFLKNSQTMKTTNN